MSQTSKLEENIDRIVKSTKELEKNNSNKKKPT